MAEPVPVRCPCCRRDHLFASPVYPCACGAPLAPPLVRAAPPERITHRTWTDDWVTVRCTECGRQDQWPQPELGCPCGTVLRIPVRPVSTPVPAGRSFPAPPAHIPLPRTATVPRPSFRPVTIRTARDAVTAATRYLQWLGFHDVVQPDTRPASGTDLRAQGLIARVDPSTRPATLRDVECLWLSGMSASASTVFFSLAGYENDARSRADGVGVPLFVMDLTGSPQPVNGPADALVSTGA
ncbi:MULTISPECIES: hypothetical protein [Streptomyces]|uniref:Uncharacterized protein n=1 Tax=Streptomyces achmelvichensis TaxID=3134111 RepID=A0ACC6Q3M7_9ACTN|nr:hypothetical protein OG317_29395 [Streptomyces sp. NBC_01167]